MPLIPHYEKKHITVSVPGELDTIKEEVKVTYYDSNNKPSPCKTCVEKKNKELTYTMKLKRTGSAYCADCAKEYHDGQDK